MAEQTDRVEVYIWPSGEDPFTRQQMNDSHTAIEDRVATFLSGTLSARPAAGASTDRMFYLATDNGILYYCNGSNWFTLNSFASPVSLEPGDTQDAGAATTLARSDHQHAMLPFGTSTVAVGTSPLGGVANEYARADHVHILANDSVTAGKIATGGVSASSQFAAGVVDSAAIAASAVTRTKIAETERMPVGSIIQFGGSTAPSGWLLCDGSSYSQQAYADLYAVLGAAYGAAGGNFQVPDMRGRVPVGSGTGAGLTARTLGGRSGVETVTLSTSQIPSHTHSIDHDHPATNTGYQGQNHVHLYTNIAFVGSGGFIAGGTTVGNATGATGENVAGGDSGRHVHAVDIPPFTGSSGSVGSGGSHDNMQPYLVVNYIIKH